MTDTNPASMLLVELALAFAVGHAPGLFARFVWKKAPLSLASAVAIGIASCVVLVFAASATLETLRVPSLQTSVSLVGASSLISIAMMVRGKRQHLMRRLQEMIADPATAEERRTLAREKLAQLEAIVFKPAPKRRLATAGTHVAEASPLSGNPLRAAGSPFGHNDAGERSKPTIRLPRTSDQKPGGWQRYGRLVAYAAGIVVALDIVLMVSGYRVLVGERIVPTGETYQTADWTYDSEDGAIIICWYWTGRSVKEISHWYGQGNTRIDECPLILDMNAAR